MTYDSETAAIIAVTAILQPFNQKYVEQWIRGRIEWMEAGVNRCPEWFQQDLKVFDPNLRCRWDSYKNVWVIEHLSYLDNLYHSCGTWDKPLGPDLIEHLRKNDTWQTTPEDIVKQRRALAEQKQKSNDAKVSDELYGAIDNMSRKQVEEFVAASEALAHGEQIVPMGEDAKFMQRLYDKNLELAKQGIEVPDRPDMAMNPEMKPGVYKRKPRKD